MGYESLTPVGDSTVLLLRGSPGVGKSTAARHLKQKGQVGALCEADAFRNMLANIDWQDRQQHSLAIQSAALTAAIFATGGASPVVLVDCFGGDNGPEAATLIEAHAASVLTVSLWAEPSVLRRRIEQRRDDYADVEMALLLNDEVRTRRLNDLLIDTTNLTPEQVSDRLDEAIKGSPCH